MPRHLGVCQRRRQGPHFSLSFSYFLTCQDEAAQENLDEARSLIDLCESNLVASNEKIIGAWPVVRVDLFDVG